MTERSNNWSVTINLKTMTLDRADEFIQLARQKGWIINGQLEQGELGTQHYQLHVKTPQVRFSAIKRAFPSAHIEVARNVKALATYVQKSETRVGALPEPDEKYMTPAKLWDIIFDRYNTNDKDGWYDIGDEHDEVKFYHESDQRLLDKDPLQWLDNECSYLIRRGYSIDALIVNPAIRSFWKKFYSDILYRSRNNVREAKDRQTDRQDDLIAQHVNIPTVDEDPSVQEEHTDEEPEDDQDEEEHSTCETEHSDEEGSGEDD